MSDAEAPSDPAEAGKRVADPETMSDSQTQQTGEHRRIGEAINGFAEMSIENVTGPQYRVLSWRNGDMRVHKVNTDMVSCTCEDMQYNTDGKLEVCDHVAYAVYHAPKKRDVGATTVQQMADMIQDMADFRNGLVQQQQAAAQESAEDDARPSLEETTPDPDVDPQAAADTLQAAYDAVVDDMQVQAANGLVWVQTGRDTPDTLPGPGNVEVFDAFLSGPDAVEYVHDDHTLVDDKPGEWWKNAIKPGDVDEYVSEVLE